MLVVAIETCRSVPVSDVDSIRCPTGCDDHIHIAGRASVRRKRSKDSSPAFRFAENRIASIELGIVATVCPHVVPSLGVMVISLMKLLKRLPDPRQVSVWVVCSEQNGGLGKANRTAAHDDREREYMAASRDRKRRTARVLQVRYCVPGISVSPEFRSRLALHAG